MDFDSIASDLANSFGTSTGNNKSVDEHSSIAADLAKQFGSPDKHAPLIKNNGRIRVSPRAPISGIESPNDIAIDPNLQPTNGYASGPSAPEPFPLSPSVVIPNVGKDIGQNFVQGASTASEGLGDIVNRGELGQGAKKLGIGALQAVTAIPAGIAQGAVEEPVTQLTGNPDIGSRAGFVAGSALPVVPGAGAISKMRPSNVALKDLVDIISNKGANPENLVEVVQGMKANPRLGPADLNPAVLSTTQKLFTTEGDATKNYLAKTSADRMASSADTVTGAYDAAAGIPVNAVQKLKDLSDAAKKVGAEQINPIIAKSPPVNISNTLTALDDVLKPGILKIGDSVPLTSVKKELSNIRQSLRTSKEYNAEDLNKFQSGLRVSGQALIKKGGNDAQVGYALMQVRQNLIKDIEAVAPGYEKALNSYKDEKHISEAFTNSYNGVLTNSKKMENLPEFTEEWVNSLTPHEKEAAKEGIRLRIRAEMGTNRNPSLAGQNLAKTDFNKQKMEMLLGKEETKQLLDTLEAERKIANTHNKMVEGSQTAMRNAGESKVALTPSKETPDAFHRLATLASYVGPEMANYYGTGYAVPGIGLATSLAANAGHKLATAATNKITRALELERNAQLAKMALPTQGPQREELIKSLEAAIPGPKQSLVTRGAKALSRLPVIQP